MDKQTASLAYRNAERALDDMGYALDNLGEEMDALGSDRLADIGARIKRATDALDKLDKACKARILAEASDGELRGQGFVARIVESVRWTLDAKVVREEMGEDWATARSKCATIRSVRYGV